MSGPLIAWAKLDGVINTPVRVRGQQVFNGLVMLVMVALGAYIVVAGVDPVARVLTLLMAKVMNRSASNVVFTDFGAGVKHRHKAGVWRSSSAPTTS